MELTDYKIAVTSRSETHNLYWMGDPHIGHKNSDRSLFEKQIDIVRRDPFGHLTLNGDIFDMVLGKDKRVDPDQVDPFFLDAGADIPEAQMDYACDILLPIREKCTGAHTGNHEDTWKVHHYNNVIKQMCKRLNIPYLTYTAFIRFYFVRQKSQVHLIRARSSHGTGGGRTKGSILNHLHQLQMSFEADIYAQGHAHRRVTDIAPYLSVPDKKIRRLDSSNRGFLATGSFFQTYALGGESSYGEKKDYPPGDLGGGIVRIQPFGEGIVAVDPLLP